MMHTVIGRPGHR